MLYSIIPVEHQLFAVVMSLLQGLYCTTYIKEMIYYHAIMIIILYLFIYLFILCLNDTYICIVLSNYHVALSSAIPFTSGYGCIS